MEPLEAKIIAVARSLASALSDFAYTRKDEDKKTVARLQHELCQAVKKEEQDAIASKSSE